MNDKANFGEVAHGSVLRPRIGFLGVGWIGRHRMNAILQTGAVDGVAIADPSDEMVESAREIAPEAERVSTLDDLLDLGVDGIVIATPSAAHAEQAIRALRHGAAVFCQKPLGRSAAEVREAVDAARMADRLLAVDMSYRFTTAMRRVRAVIQSGELGRIYAADFIFHNAYGPDKPWFYDRNLAGGGCVMDLGVHLVDLALWALGFPQVTGVQSRLLAQGEPLLKDDRRVEDYAVATLELADGKIIRIACSWRLQAGREADISASFYGTEGGVSFRNVDGSFYDFVAERHNGTTRTTLAEPPDDWGGRAAQDWAERLARGERFDPGIERLVDVAAVLDLIYGR
jgi:predicted dehydrogenase